jgi:hypothetical protein
MKRSTTYGDLVLTPAERKGMRAFYLARMRAEREARIGVQYTAAKERLRGLESVRDSAHTHEGRPLACASEWTQFLGRRK